MFDFLFKRATDKSAEPQRASAASEASDGAAAQAASRRDEQTARARLLAGDEAAAVELILQSEFAGVRLAAAEHVVSQPALEQVLLAMRNSDRRVAKLMQGRLDAIRYRFAEQQKAQTCIAQAERLLQDEKLTPNMVADLDRQWSVTAAAAEQAERFAPQRAALAQRLESQVSLQRAVIDALAELRALPAAGLAPAAAAEALERLRAVHAAALASAELTSLPKHLLNDVAAALESAGAALQALQQHQAVFDARQAALAEWQAAAPDSLGAEQLRRAWQALGAVPAGELAARQQAELDVVLAAVAAANPPPAPVERGDKARDANAANAARPAKPARAGKEDDQQDNKRFVETLDALEAALEQGLLHAAAEHDKWLKEHKGGRLTPAQSERLAHLRAELKRLGDWARWGGNVSREELVKAVEELAAQGLAMSELAKKVGSMRERWKGLDAVSGHAPKACGSASTPPAAPPTRRPPPTSSSWPRSATTTPPRPRR
ncbi:hypothetical protein [Rugamonas sp. DEMB1]|uniref:hypothetical protein n=1 Tax=Rugamonas sp. DEMB1 TaxID=3039386 RepID=UPI00244AD896|nr:hypothetical protein [Rugamonas sp. DEMB1]WGG52290.1 hypothetical protein QC826_09095 [Rugamonas sp. DEMB1]